MMDKIKRKAILLGSIIVVVLIGFLGTANLYKLYAYYYRAPRLNLNIKSQVYKNDKFKISGSISPCYNKHSKVNLYRKYYGKRYYARIARLSANRKCQFSYYTRLSKTATFKAKIYDRYVYSKARKVGVKTKPTSSTFRPIVIYGDSRTGHEIHQKIVNAIISLKPIAVFHTGDLVSDGTSNADWTAFNNITANLRSITSFYPALGNHEGNSALYYNNFTLPNNEQWYSVNIEGIHFVVLDSNAALSAGSEQYLWLEDDLRSNQNASFSVVIFHHPFYSTGSHPEDEKGIRAMIVPLFLQYGVDAVFNGHNHGYERSLANNIYYFVMAGAGAPLYDQIRGSSYSQKFLESYNFGKIMISDGKMNFRVYNDNSILIDEVTISNR